MADNRDAVEALTQRLMQQDKVQQAVLVLTLASIEEHIEESGWDQPPWLYLLYRRMPPTELADQMMHNAGQAVQLMAVQPLGTLPFVGGGDQVAATLLGLADSMRDRTVRTTFSPELGPDMVAWVLAHEGWAVESPRGSSPEEEEELIRMGQAHRLSEHPQRREVRIISAVDRTLARYQVVRVRDGERRAALDEESEVELSGQLIEALAVLMEATP